MAKYVSHREAQTISLACTKVIKRNTISHSDDYKALHNSIPLFLWPFNHKTQKYEHLRIFSEYYFNVTDEMGVKDMQEKKPQPTK